jgi:hypothetical protein
MKNVLFFSAVVCFSFSCFAADPDSGSILSVFYRLQNLTDEFVAQANHLDSAKQDLNNKVLKEVILEKLEPLATEDFLEKWGKRIDTCSALGWQLARTDDFGWGLPTTDNWYFKFVVEKNPNRKEAKIICHGRTPDVFSMPEIFFQDSDSSCSEIKNPWDEKYKLVKWRNKYRTEISFLKTVSGWKVSGFNEEVVHLKLASQ